VNIITVRVDTANIGKLIAQLSAKSQEAVNETAATIQSRASQMAPKDTTSLAESIYVNNGEQSDYAARTGRARNVNRDVIILEEIRPEFSITLFGSSDQGYSAVVGVAAAHGVYQEYGTRFMGPQPFLTPSVEPMRDVFVNTMSHIAD